MNHIDAWRVVPHRPELEYKVTTASYGGSFVMTRLVAEPRLTSAWHIQGATHEQIAEGIARCVGKLDKVAGKMEVT